MSNSKFPIIVFHNVTSANRCSEFVKIAAGMGFKTLVITQAQGSAAQRGLPAAQKLAFKHEINFMSLYELNDLTELFNPDELVLIVPPPYGKTNLDSDFVKTLEGKRWIAVFGGNDPGLSRKDIEKGDSIVQLPAGDLGSVGTLVLGLALLTGKFGFNLDQQ
ncbi:MAG: RecB-family nuclease [Candidatus Kariarchaeaceae archaeon]|jgi:SpoU rRNA methylase family enzyme